MDSFLGEAGMDSFAIDGFQLLQQSLLDHGYDFSDLSIQFTEMTLGPDDGGHPRDGEGLDWEYDPGTTTETRRYIGGTFTVLLRNKNQGPDIPPFLELVTANMPEFTLVIEYNDVDAFDDDRVRGFTQVVSNVEMVDVPAGLGAGADPAASSVAHAFINEAAAVGGFQFIFDTFQRAVQTEFGRPYPPPDGPGALPGALDGIGAAFDVKGRIAPPQPPPQ